MLCGSTSVRRFSWTTRTAGGFGGLVSMLLGATAMGLRKIPVDLFNGLNRRTDTPEKPLVFYPRQVFQKTFPEANLHCPPSNIEKTFLRETVFVPKPWSNGTPLRLCVSINQGGGHGPEKPTFYSNPFSVPSLIAAV